MMSFLWLAVTVSIVAIIVWALVLHARADRQRPNRHKTEAEPHGSLSRKKDTAKRSTYLVDLKGAMRILVEENLSLRLLDLPAPALEASERLIDKLRRLLDQLYAKSATDSLTELMTKVATDHLSRVTGQYLILPQADREAQLESFRQTLAAIEEEVDSALEHLRQGRLTEFKVSASLIKDLGVEVLPDQSEDASQPLTAALEPAEKRLIDRQLAAIRQLSGLVPEAERYKLTLKDAKPGGFLNWKGMVWQVEEAHLYREDDRWEWTELKLFCLNDGQTVNLEWEEDDELEVSQSVKQLRWTDLTDESGQAIDEDDLEQIVRDQDSIFLDRDEFEFDEDCDTVFYRHGGEEGEPVWTVDFESTVDDGYGVTIEEWNDGQGTDDYEIWLWREVSPDAVEVIKQGG